MKTIKQAILFLLFLSALPAGKEALAQGCSGSVPLYNVNLTASPTSTWTSTSVSRNGQCCGLSTFYRCIHFTVTLNSNAMGIRIDVSGTSTGYTFESNCGSSTGVGDTMCLSTVGPHEITICRTGFSASQTYTIRSIPKPTVNAGNDTTICASLNAVNLRGTITNASTYQWTGQGGRFIPNANTLKPTYVPSLAEVAAGTTKLILSTTGCAVVRDTMVVTINPAPNPVISGATEVCAYSISQNYSVPSVAGNAYDWHVVGGTIASGQGTRQINVTWDTTGPGYMYMIQTSTSGCQGVGAINTISRFDFNGGPLSQATVGPNAISYDTDAYSNGQGFVITSNTGGTKGIDLVLPGSIFDRGRMCMTFSWQRDESQANFFTRGGVDFRINGGVLEIGMRLTDGLGGYIDTGPVSSGYTVPDDDIFRYFTFCYDSASGIGRVMVNDSLVWSYNGTPDRSLYWTGSGNATLGTFMDGSGKGGTLLDWSNISIPITVLARPKPSLSGPLTRCQNKGATYTTSTGKPYYKNTWLVTGGTILNGQNTGTINVLWTTPGTQTVQVTQLDTINGCDSVLTLSVVVSPTPVPIITGPDTICVNGVAKLKGPVAAGITYLWSSATATFTGGTNKDSATVGFNTAGLHTVSLRMTNNTSGCDSTITKNIFVDSLPATLVTGNNPVCQEWGINNYQTIYNSNYSYQWSVTGGNIASGQGTYATTVDWTAPGTGYVMVIAQKITSGCTSENQMSVTVHPKPVSGSINYH